MQPALEAAQLPTETAELMRVAANTVELTGDSARTMLKLLEALEDHDDVQNVTANFEVSDTVMAAL